MASWCQPLLGDCSHEAGVAASHYDSPALRGSEQHKWCPSNNPPRNCDRSTVLWVRWPGPCEWYPRCCACASWRCTSRTSPRGTQGPSACKPCLLVCLTGVPHGRLPPLGLLTLCLHAVCAYLVPISATLCPKIDASGLDCGLVSGRCGLCSLLPSAH